MAGVLQLGVVADGTVVVEFPEIAPEEMLRGEADPLVYKYREVEVPAYLRTLKEPVPLPKF
jgi:hypothetical protein